MIRTNPHVLILVSNGRYGGRIWKPTSHMLTAYGLVNPPSTPRTPLPVKIRIPVFLGVRDVVRAELRVDLPLVLSACETLVPLAMVQEAGFSGAAWALAEHYGFVEAIVVE
jgi:hypothetical protein